MKNKNLIINCDTLYNEDLEENKYGEVKLWRSVINKALEDKDLPPTNKRYRTWKKQAQKWLDINNDDFLNVCEYAMVSPEKVLSIALKN
ncbi:MAG: hypothetical protein AABY27_06345 [Pseudomonadota bacterium]